MLELNSLLLILGFATFIFAGMFIINYQALKNVFKKCETPEEFYQSVAFRKKIYKNIDIKPLFNEDIYLKIIFRLMYGQAYDPKKVKDIDQP